MSCNTSIPESFLLVVLQLLSSCLLSLSSYFFILPNGLTFSVSLVDQVFAVRVEEVFAGVTLLPGSVGPRKPALRSCNRRFCLLLLKVRAPRGGAAAPVLGDPAPDPGKDGDERSVGFSWMRFVGKLLLFSRMEACSGEEEDAMIAVEWV